MIQYVEDIIIPYVKEAREISDDWKPTPIIMDNFKEQTNDKKSLIFLKQITSMLHNFFPPSITDQL